MEGILDLIKQGELANVVKEQSKGEQLTTPDQVYNVFRSLTIEQDDVEQMWVMWLDAQNRIIATEKISTGTLSSAVVYPREVIKKALRHKAAACILAHNHPSGNTKPSREDDMITRRLYFALAAIDVPLHDHLIIGSTGYHSYADNMQLQSCKEDIQRYLHGRGA